MSEPKPECCLCEPVKTFRTWTALVNHLAQEHDDTPYPGSPAGYENELCFWDFNKPGGELFVGCWCNPRSIDMTLDEFAEHLRVHGGMAHHFAELQLGVITL